MGNNSSAPKSNCGGKALNMLQTKPNLYNTNEQLSVKFSRNDLVDSVSALSMGTALKPMNGGGRLYSDNHLHPNAPQHQSYLKYLSTKTMDMNGGGASTLSSGIVNNLSSESEGDWNQIKSMLIRGQNGGCGCDAGRVLQDGGNNNLSASSSFDLSFSNSQSTMSADSEPKMYGGNLYSATSPMNMSMSQHGGNLYSATSPMNMSMTQHGGNLYSATSQSGGKWDSATNSSSMQNINYEMLLGGKKTHKDSSSSSSPQSSTSLSDIDASSSSSTSTTMSGSSPEGVIKRALSKNAVSDTTRELKRMEASEEQKKEKVTKSSASSSSSSSSSDSSKSTSSSSSSSSMSSSSSSQGNEAFAKITRYDNIVLTSEGSATNNNVINVKQFYSTDNSELFSASSNFLRNNINKNRLR